MTAVGGTSLGVTKGNARLFELGWETTRATLDSTSPKTPKWSAPTYIYGSGGGTSRLFAQPAYQAGIVPNAIATRYGGPAMRVVPDVAALGDPTTGMLVGMTQHFTDGTDRYSEYRIGGTSLSSPLFAGMLAVAQQHRASRPFGLANVALYRAATTSGGYRYTARYFDQDKALTIHVVKGYDDVTGVGSPNGAGWLAALG